MDIKKRLFGMAVVLAVAAMAVLISGGHNATKAASGAPVNIMSPLPLPITGTATVSGTVGATQSGAWNINVANSPSVSVANPATAPVLVRDVENPAHFPARFVGQLAISPGSDTVNAELFNSVIPVGKRAVLEYASHRCTSFSPGGVDVTRLQLTTAETTQNAIVLHLNELSFTKGPTTASGNVGFSGSQPLRLYHDGGLGSQPMIFTVGLTNGVPAGGGVTCQIELSGYMVNVP
jgi:hypothetical protein